MASESNAPPLEKTADLLDEDRYWSIIHRAQEATEDLEEMEEHLIGEVEKLTPKEMVGFYLRTSDLEQKAYTSELWCAAYIINGGASDDGFEYFRCWLISAGKDVYYKAIEHPDSLADLVEEGNDYEFESLTYVPITSFENKTGQDLYDYVETISYTVKEMEFTWEEENLESQKKICPKLYAKFRGE
ncbi:DUF4240 domain-containing protein [Fulvivirgaceae bacterium PWU5]|uniref:DUF4240 domain-containing protein n=1 Tax=Dawidia cretensis TaxID=2782350 RepID=A0AAP2DVN1_9BACT|nr:DUF4240 domain-containing protein [Dawidia cretensis]MBT1708440.1 DUF4240 domain-containing protein [Dawidia cretensis]